MDEIIQRILERIEANELEEALAMIQENEELYGRKPEFLKTKAVLSIKVGEYETAVNFLKQAREENPDDGELYYYLSYAYEFLIQQQKKRDGMVICSDDKEALVYQDDLNLYQNRIAMDNLEREKVDPLVSIVFIGYNNLEKYTKPAIECLLKYTTNVDCEWILIDNGSSDGTFEFFQSVSFPRKCVYRLTKNIGAFFGHQAVKNNALRRFFRGKYLVNVPNDVLVTPNWLANMLICAQSDERIGMVVPMTDNSSNFQTVNLQFNSFEEMQRKAAAFNISNPKTWEERMRLIPYVSLIKSELYFLYQGDAAFIYNFADDDMSFQYRRAGYKLFLCGDVFVHHEGSSVSAASSEKYAEDLEKGREIFRKKYYGIDAWNDVLNFEQNLLRDLIIKEKTSANVLGVDVRCGTPLLELKNRLRRAGRFQLQISAFSRRAKYWLDLKTVCNGEVVCATEDSLGNYFNEEKFDYIVVGEPLNRYANPFLLLKTLLEKLRPHGQLAVKIENIYTIENFLRVKTSQGKEEFLSNMEAESLDQWMKAHTGVIQRRTVMGCEEQQMIQQLNHVVCKAFGMNQAEQIASRLLEKEYIWVVQRSLEKEKIHE